MSTKNLRINRSFLTVALSLLVLVMAFACNGESGDTGTGDDNNNMGSAVTPPSVQMATLTLGTSPGGSTAADCVSNCSGEPGWNASVTASPDSGYIFVGWECSSGSCSIGNDGANVGTTLTITIHEDTHITPVFERIPDATLTLGTSPGGSAAVDCFPDCSGEPGWNASVTVSPDSGYRFVQWECSGSCPTGIDNTNMRTILTIYEDTHITPVFEFISDATLTVIVGAGGRIDGLGGEIQCDGPTICRYEIPAGERIVLDADADAGYEVGEWRRVSGDDFSYAPNSNIDLILTHDNTLEVTFIPEVLDGGSGIPVACSASDIVDVSFSNSRISSDSQDVEMTVFFGNNCITNEYSFVIRQEQLVIRDPEVASGSFSGGGSSFSGNITVESMCDSSERRVGTLKNFWIEFTDGGTKEFRNVLSRQC